MPVGSAAAPASPAISAKLSPEGADGGGALKPPDHAGPERMTALDAAGGGSIFDIDSPQSPAEARRVLDGQGDKRAR